jgi:hypothetical protein
MLSSCNYSKYSNGIKEETKKSFKEHKNYIYNLFFKGEIIKKEKCEKCQINKYSISLKLIRLNEKPSIGNTQYPPYYSFECDSILNITVSPNIFNQVEENEVVVKESHSSYLKIENNLILYLDSEEYQWLP